MKDIFCLRRCFHSLNVSYLIAAENISLGLSVKLLLISVGSIHFFSNFEIQIR